MSPGITRHTGIHRPFTRRIPRFRVAFTADSGYSLSTCYLGVRVVMSTSQTELSPPTPKAPYTCSSPPSCPTDQRLAPALKCGPSDP